MNQQILFNDDMVFDREQQAWVFTGLLSGERITIIIEVEEPLPLNEELRFDFEYLVEEWLEDNEPSMNGEIHLLSK